MGWLVAVHLVFVTSTLMLALSDRRRGEQPGHESNTLMVRSAASRVANHEAEAVARSHPSRRASRSSG
jgi:hypothetical protein